METIDWHQYFTYDGETGNLIWKPRPDLKGRAASWNTRFAGTVAGTPDGLGYCVVAVNGTLYRAHRIIYEMANGPIPEGFQIDHVDGNKGNNSPQNLRLATSMQNGYNRGASPSNTSGHKGVSWVKRRNKWLAQIRICGKNTNLGLFTKIEDAIAAYADAAAKYHGEFARTS